MFPIKDDQPRYSRPYVNGFLIGLNVLIFLFETQLNQPSLKALFDQFALVPANVSALALRHDMLSTVIPFFTAMFLHQGWAHVLGNVWILYIYGDNVEDYLGHFKYLVFYLLAGLLADTAQIAANQHSRVGMVGASGAIAGVLGAYFILYPRARVLTWFPPIFIFYLPAWIGLGYWFVLQFFQGTVALSVTSRRDVGGVAFWAHVGGFVAGVVMIKLFPERQRRNPYAHR
jgi:membrane associated rhomboid family serine protease